MKHKISELEGRLLDWAVSLALGMKYANTGCVPKWFGHLPSNDARSTNEPFEPSTDWRHGGPIIERERIGVWAGVEPYSGKPAPDLWFAEGPGTSAARARTTGATLLIAAMRAYVASKFGDEADLPETV
jgi:Protein of unknown function (DUF2591)